MKILAGVVSIIKSLIIALIIALLISIFIIQPYQVRGESMQPTLQGSDEYDPSLVGDRLFVFKSAYIGDRMPKYGDIVVIDSRIDEDRSIKNEFFESPLVEIITRKKDEGNQNKWVKRVIGKEGDTISYKDGSVYRNGKLVKEDYVKEKIDEPFDEVVVPKGEVFVMGDNRNHSTDSRILGTIPKDHIIGKVVLRFYPFNKFGTF